MYTLSGKPRQTTLRIDVARTLVTRRAQRLLSTPPFVASGYMLPGTWCGGYKANGSVQFFSGTTMTNLIGFGAVDTGIGTSNGDEDMAAVLSVGWLSTCVFCVGTLRSDI